jgi:hypothetical protein
MDIKVFFLKPEGPMKAAKNVDVLIFHVAYVAERTKDFLIPNV